MRASTKRLALIVGVGSATLQRLTVTSDRRFCRALGRAGRRCPGRYLSCSGDAREHRLVVRENVDITLKHLLSRRSQHPIIGRKWCIERYSKLQIGRVVRRQVLTERELKLGLAVDAVANQSEFSKGV